MPGVLVAVVLSIVAAILFDLADHGVSLVGTLPQGFPPLTVPARRRCPTSSCSSAGRSGIALVSLADTISTASAFARADRRRRSTGTRRCSAIGAANIAAGLFQGFPVSTSGSRTAVAEQAGAKTQVTGIVGALTIAVMLLFVPGLLRDLPQPTLAAVVIVGVAVSLADIPGTTRLWHQRRAEFSLSIAAFLGVALLGVLPGIAWRWACRWQTCSGARGGRTRRSSAASTGLPGYHDVRSYPDAELLPGLVIFRFDAPLFFANARTFRDQIVRLASGRAGARMDPRRGGADHRRRHDGGRHAGGSGRGAQREGHLAWCSPR